MYIISDDILEGVVCSTCKKYLSVPPVKVYPNRAIKCGRCVNPGDDGVPSLFSVLVEGGLFRCIHRFDGCSKLLRHSEVLVHENFCNSKLRVEELDCPVCAQSYKGSTYQIYYHFKTQHKDFFLKNSFEISIEIDSELLQTYLFSKNDLLFFLNVRYTKSNEELYINIIYVGPDEDAANMQQSFILQSCRRRDIIVQLKGRSCSSVMNDDEKGYKVALQSDNKFYKNVVLCRFSVNTTSVEKMLVLSEGTNNRALVSSNLSGSEERLSEDSEENIEVLKMYLPEGKTGTLGLELPMKKCQPETLAITTSTTSVLQTSSQKSTVSVLENNEFESSDSSADEQLQPDIGCASQVTTGFLELTDKKIFSLKSKQKPLKQMSISPTPSVSTHYLNSGGLSAPTITFYSPSISRSSSRSSIRSEEGGSCPECGRYISSRIGMWSHRHNKHGAC